jgi:hypothetical protein
MINGALGHGPLLLIPHPLKVPAGIPGNRLKAEG